MVNWKAKRTTREQSSALFSTERDLILKLVRSSASSLLPRRILIKRLQGLEDSSRYWSVLMTLDHLRIVNTEIAEVIRLLPAGKTPQHAASTAAVKPSESVDDSAMQGFVTACQTLEQTVAATRNLATHTKYPHPWFGPLDAAGWHFMSAFHMRLHRKQIEAILSKLQ